jgi:tRNA1(Val) A37 N6-methylase TrmN6
MIAARMNSKSMTQILPPFVVFDDESVYGEKAQKAFEKANTNSINPEKIQFVHSKLDRESKLVMIAARMNSRSMTQILPPFVVFDDKSIYREKAQKAFKKAGTNSIKGDF